MSEKINISEETQIDKPASREMIPVEKCDWERIKRLLSQIDADKNKWENAAWFMAATDIAFLISLLTTSLKIEFSVALFFSLIITIILFVVSRQKKEEVTSSKEAILLEMKQVEEKIAK